MIEPVPALGLFISELENGGQLRLHLEVLQEFRYSLLGCAGGVDCFDGQSCNQL